MGLMAKLRALALGADPASKLKILFFTWSHVKRRLSHGLDIQVKIRKFGRTCPFTFRDASDLGAFKEIFLGDVYGGEIDGEPDVILDLGSNCGLSVIYFKLRYPAARVYAFEPDPASFEKLTMNAGHLEGVRLFNQAIAGKGGRVRFFVNPEDSLSASLRARAEGQPSVEVEARTLDEVMEELSIGEVGLLKFDIEGAELEALRGFRNMGRVRNLMGEVHPDLMGGTAGEFMSLLEGFEAKIKRTGPERFTVTARRRRQAAGG
ncbi:MAG: hypothetical protein Kow0025_15540 [Thermodesulfovibrionales bacterium]